MHVLVKTVDGKVLTLDASESDSIASVKQNLQENHHFPASMQRLVFSGSVLKDEASLSDCAVDDGATVNLVLRLRGGGPSKKRCSFKTCSSTPLRIVGDCSFCDGHFCAKHRLLEDHKCTGLQNCKQQLHDRNAVKLQQEQTVASKV
ncbi:ubiquitin-related domain-containing protein [Kockiozyma suomiensis]|uniref:ubiquitin-related domain-containing protein n=1 Tax=Kockiozyma suomiensis TaxID=1337062 RepID=UPI003343930A